MIIASASSYCKCNTRAYSSCFMHAIVAHMRLLFFKIFSNFVYFSQIFKYFAPFCPFLSFFWKIARIPLLSRIGPEYPWCQWKYTSNWMLRFCKEMLQYYQYSIHSKDWYLVEETSAKQKHNQLRLFGA